jgi:hypothetical protein
MEPSVLSLTFEITPIAKVTSADRDALWEVYRRHFDAERAQLDASLARADQVILFRERRTRRLRGLVVFSLNEAEHAGRRFFWLWAGALAIDRECRGKWLLERSGLAVLLRFRLRHPGVPLFWIYESNSFQSYRMMARSFEVFWPHPERVTPDWEREVVGKLAREHYPERWDPERRVLRPTGKKHVRPDSSQTSLPPSEPLRAFYQAVNPEAELGASVVLLAALDRTNITTLLWRMSARMLGGQRPWQLHRGAPGT